MTPEEQARRDAARKYAEALNDHLDARLGVSGKWRVLRETTTDAIKTIKLNLDLCRKGFELCRELRAMGIEPVGDAEQRLKDLDAKSFGDLLAAQSLLEIVDAAIEQQSDQT